MPGAGLHGARWRNVWLLAATSLISDVSGEMLQAVLPFLLLAQGATGLGIGLTGGITEGVGHIVKLAGGYLGDRVRKRRYLVGAGYLLASASRFGVALAPVWQVSLAFRSLDRVGKGLREAPRDAILADSIPRESRGRAFGLHRAGDTLGAVLGVLLALAILWTLHPGASASKESLESLEATVVLVGACIGITSIVPLLFVREEADGGPSRAQRAPEAPSPHYRSYLAVAGLFYLGHVSYLFFILRASEGPSGSLPPVIAAVLWYLVFNVVYVIASYPAGILTDRVGRVRVLLAGYGLAAAACGAFVVHPATWTLALGFLALGVSYACTEGTGRALAADLAGSKGRSLRMGWYQFTVGLATLGGGIAAGLLWDVLGHGAAFAWGAGASALALVALAIWAARPGGPQRESRPEMPQA